MWICPTPEKLPDFIIGGAMKAGTKTLHKILNSHPDVFIPNGEIHFFNHDEICEHFDFNHYNKKSENWSRPEIIRDGDINWAWYLDRLDSQSKVIGEDSTCYLSSPLAAKRISSQDKRIKMIFTLRQRSLRAYSHYEHNLRAGRINTTFEETLIKNPYGLLSRSLYVDQLEQYYKYFDRDDILVVTLESLKSNPYRAIQRICKFLAIDFDRIPDGILSTKANVSSNKAFDFSYRLTNRFLKPEIDYTEHFLSGRTNQTKQWFSERLKYWLNSKGNLGSKESGIRAGTKRFLDQFFIKRLEGLDDLTKQKIMATWFDDFVKKY
ncbi:MAG: sulfotransferase domain-containing protein [Cytophagales bacterium]